MFSDNLPYEKVGKNEPVCIADEVPFEIPESWEWVRLDSLVIKEIKRGKSPKYAASSNVTVFAQKCNVKAGGIDLSLAKKLDISVFPKYPVEEYMIDGDVVVNSTGNGTLGRIGIFRDSDRISNDTIVPDSHVTVIRSSQEIIVDYIYCVLEYYQPELEKQGEGSTNQTELKPAVLANLFVPVPPKYEQRRIVNALTLLRKQIIDYDYKEKSLSELNRTFPDLLKKSILQQAVMGKLVPQDPIDEPASALLDRIRAEKQSLIKAGKLKKDKHESIIYRRDNSHYEKIDGKETCIDDEIPCDIPDNWSWCRLKHLVSFIGGYAYKSEDFVAQSEFQVLRLGNIKNDTVIKEKKPVFIPSELAKATSGFVCNNNDILVTMTGTRGKRDYFFTARIKDEQNLYINQRVGCLRSYLSDISEWLVYTLKSECILSQVFEHETGTANQGNLGAESIMQTLIPLPPLSEQRRIITCLCQTLNHISAL